MTTNGNAAVSEWIKKYIELLVDELRPKGDVLEIGFGTGIAADRIQKSRPKSHTIIESDEKLIESAREWAKKHPNTKVIHDSWENALKTLHSFDEVFFNDFSEDAAVQLILRSTPQGPAEVSSQTKDLLASLEKQLSQISITFSDQEIDDFYNKVGKSNLKELPSFFKKLKDNKNITEQQYTKALEKYGISEHGTESQKPQGQLLLFLEACLAKHMKKGSRFSCFLASTHSKYEDSHFFDRIITNPNIDFHEKTVKLAVPNCPLEDALVVTIEKT
ncbi:MAG: methyltransferase domain-containing protein [Verrucomicrobia bacterium]|nr:methyltransferase domain-containing protein [Verrucomicrobiota bacterium]